MAKSNPTNYIFVTGGVLSGLGKGITAASLGTILKARGFSVNIQKLDPYFNTDAGTLNPAEHGEVFVTKDGAETDLDLGHYERFLDEELTATSSVMNGRIYAKVISDERTGKYLGKTIQIIPHITNEIQEQILNAGAGHDFHIVEIGGTVGDIESLATLEAARQMRRKLGSGHTFFIHVVYLPFLQASGELKTKPAQNSVRDLREAGLQPDVVIARADRPIAGHIVAKLGLFVDVDEGGIVPVPTADSVYEVPLVLESAGLGDYITRHLSLPERTAKLGDWQRLVKLIKHPEHRTLRIGVVAKYMDNEDTYLSVFEALKAAGWANQVSPDIGWVDAEELERQNVDILDNYDGLLVPGGFGKRGLEGKIKAASFALTHNKPYLGLCLGLQMAVVAAARNAGLGSATSFELDPNAKLQVITTMNDQKGKENTGGTMRLGDYPCVIAADSKVARAYGATKIVERHRHRGECNNDFRDQYEAWGIRAVGLSPDNHLVEIIEAVGHPFFAASQFHPEFKSRPGRPHPLFAAFIQAALGAKQERAAPTARTRATKTTR